jgi:hypothetical protein
MIIIYAVRSFLRCFDETLQVLTHTLSLRIISPYTSKSSPHINQLSNTSTNINNNRNENEAGKDEGAVWESLSEVCHWAASANRHGGGAVREIPCNRCVARF